MTAVGFIVTGVIEDDHLSKGNPVRYSLSGLCQPSFGLTSHIKQIN